jgi:GH15 family glucan-1,4-alpha-glucosidase
VHVCPQLRVPSAPLTMLHRAAPMSAPSAHLPQPPIEDYAIIGDCRTAALVSREGAIEWLCLPDYASPSIFANILSPTRGGRFSIRPREAFVSTRKYVGASPVLETTFQTPSGSARVVDFLPVLDGVQSLQPMREVLRVIEGISGQLDLDIEVDPRPDYARAQPRLEGGPRGSWYYRWSNEIMIVAGDIELERAASALRRSILVRAGDRIHLSLAFVKSDVGVLPALGQAADDRLRCTLDWWQGWIGGCRYEGPYKDAVLRSALTLKLLSFALSGAMTAAPTTSLPEAIGADRNWDYRYCWLRDAGMTVRALVELGFHDEAGSFLGWLLHATRLTRPKLRILYDVYGRSQLPEKELEHFEGYRGSKPVRIGNDAYVQQQLDVYGEVMFAADAYVEGGGTIEPVERRMLIGFGKVVCRQWREPDQSIWELRGPPRQHTFSKVMCWVALDRLLALHEKRVLSLGSLAARFRSERDAIADAIERRAYNSRIESYVAEFEGETVDASLLLMPVVGYKPADHPRVCATYRRVWQRLGRGGLLARYERGYDESASKEGAFAICAYWAVHHLVCRGDIAEARWLFEHALSFASDLGLLAEEIDPTTGAALGNFPQAFAHVGLINAAIAIRRASKQ